MDCFIISWLDFKIEIFYDQEFDLYNVSKYYFEPWYNVIKHDNIGKCQFRVEVKNDNYNNQSLKGTSHKNIILRGTKDPLWSITAKKYEYDDIELFEINERNAFVKLENKNKITLYSLLIDTYIDTIVFRELFVLIIDSIIIKYAESIGGLLFHAAAFGSEQNANLIIGERGSGKTTTLLSAVKDKNNNCISNDRCIIMLNNNGFMIYGLPYTINIRPESISMFSEIDKHINNINISPNDKIVLSHKDVIENNIQCGMLSNILLPNCKIPKETKIYKILGNDASEYLYNSCHSYNNIKFNDWHNIFLCKYNDQHKRSLITTICNNIPIYYLDWGSDLVEKYNEIITNYCLY